LVRIVAEFLGELAIEVIRFAAHERDPNLGQSRQPR
jgi:hypothetical protein